jgi:Sulfotransferase family
MKVEEESLSELVFVFGIMQRSGTNYLSDLLTLHEQCRGSRIYEDFLVANSGLLERYVDAVSKNWRREWFQFAIDEEVTEIAKALGSGLEAFCGGAPTSHRYLVCKTPNSLNIDHTFRFFPTARVIVIVRDGRDLVESYIRSFSCPGSWETLVREWCLSAQRIAAFLETSPARERALLVRYEDLFSNTAVEMRRILKFLRLKTARYDFGKAARLPIRGSSVFGRQPGSAVSWQQVARTADFVPIGRFRDWSGRRLRRFSWLAGRESAHLGYALEIPSGGTGSAAIQRLLDYAWRLREWGNSIRFLLERALWSPQADFRDSWSSYYSRSTPPELYRAYDRRAQV